MSKKLKPRGPLTVRAVLDTLLLIDEAVSDIDTIRRWRRKQRLQVYDWAIRTHLRSSDNVIAVPKRPGILKARETK